MTMIGTADHNPPRLEGHERTFSFFRSLSRNAVAHIFDMRVEQSSDKILRLADPGIRIWSYSLFIHTTTGRFDCGRVASPLWNDVPLEHDMNFDIVIHDEDSGADVGTITFVCCPPRPVPTYPKKAFIGPDRGSFCTRLMFPRSASEADLFSSLCGTEGLSPQRLQIGAAKDRLYALYTDSIDGSTSRSNVYAPSIDMVPAKGNRFSRVEVFCKDTSGDMGWRAICDVAPDFQELDGGDRIYYKFSLGSRDSIVIYFDYSRNFEKISVYDEYLPRFNMQTKSSVLVVGNCFGFWGTASCFGSDGTLIIADLLEFLKDMIAEAGAERVYLVGGSQGATAALVFGGLLPHVEQIHASAPVPFSTKSMLRHLRDSVRHRDISLAEDLTLSTLRGRVVDLYSAQGDPLCDWHADLASTSDFCRLHTCEEDGIGHAQCLRYYIKHIYADITEKENAVA